MLSYDDYKKELMEEANYNKIVSNDVIGINSNLANIKNTRFPIRIGGFSFYTLFINDTAILLAIIMYLSVPILIPLSIIIIAFIIIKILNYLSGKDGSSSIFKSK
jgi:hypothetical protein